jgi:excisionase family DNA binding protein
MAKKTEPLTITVEEAGRLLGLGRNSSYIAAKTGELPVIKIGRRLLVPRAALEKLLKKPEASI